MGWSIHSNLTGGMQPEMLITQVPIKLSKAFLDQLPVEEGKNGYLTTQKEIKDTSTSLLMCFLCLHCLNLVMFFLVKLGPDISTM